MNNLLINNLINFEGKDINYIIGQDGEPLFELYSVGQALGYEHKRKNSTGKEYISPYKSRIDKIVESAEITGVYQGGTQFLTEEMLYDFMFEAKTNKCKTFRKWLSKDILPKLRSTGVVILDNATDEAIDFEKKFGKYRIRRTFTNSQDLRKDWEQLTELSKIENKAKRLTGTERLKLYNITFSAVQERLNNNITELRGSELLAMQELLTDIKAATLELSNRVNGGIKSDLTKKLNTANEQLEEAKECIDYLFPKEEEWKYLNLHGFSVNSMYEPYVNRATNEASERRTRAYRMWAVDFAEEMTKLDLDIDFSNGVDVFLKFDYMPRFDCHNFSKSFIDCFANYYGVNDNNFQLKCCDKNSHVDSFDEGRIWFVVRPRVEE